MDEIVSLGLDAFWPVSTYFADQINYVRHGWGWFKELHTTRTIFHTTKQQALVCNCNLSDFRSVSENELQTEQLRGNHNINTPF